jgi:hypothetical protein
VGEETVGVLLPTETVGKSHETREHINKLKRRNMHRICFFDIKKSFLQVYFFKAEYFENVTVM